MSEWRVEVIEVGAVRKHPNADTLSITDVHGGYPVIFRTGDFHEGDTAVYVPVDSVVDSAKDPQWAFLGGHNRVKAKRLRGVFSMGVLCANSGGWRIGELVHRQLGITKYEPPVSGDLAMNTEDEPEPPWLFPKYTDIESLRRWPDVLQKGEEVIITEKIHGANGRFAWRNGRLWVGSRTRIKNRDERNLWWRVALHHRLEQAQACFDDNAVYGEVYGQVQDLKYGVRGGDTPRLALFDSWNFLRSSWFPWIVTEVYAESLELPTVPVLYRGPWSSDLRSLAEGSSTIPGADNVREGIVIRPAVDRWHEGCGRVLLKLHGEGYLLRKSTTWSQHRGGNAVPE